MIPVAAPLSSQARKSLIRVGLTLTAIGMLALAVASVQTPSSASSVSTDASPGPVLEVRILVLWCNATAAGFYEMCMSNMGRGLARWEVKEREKAGAGRSGECRSPAQRT